MNILNCNLSDFYTKQRECRFLQLFELKRSYNSDGDLNLVVDLEYNNLHFNSNAILHATFYEVVNLEINCLDALYAHVVEILDISGDQLENINYEVREIENVSFTFLCKHYELRLHEY